MGDTNRRSIFTSTEANSEALLNELNVTFVDDNLDEKEKKTREWEKAVVTELKQLDDEQGKLFKDFTTASQTTTNILQKVEKIIEKVTHQDEVINKLKGELHQAQEKIKQLEKRSEENFDDLILTKNNLSKEVTENYQSLHEIINNSLNKSQLNESIIETFKQPALTCPIFDESYKFRPIKFLDDFERYLKASKYNHAQLLCLLSQSMNGINSSWYDLIQRDINSFEDFAKLFKDKFWNSDIRRNISREIEFGKYYANGKLSRYNYAIRKVNLAYDIDKDLNERELIEKLSRHFDREVRLVIQAKNITKTSEFMKVLSSLDNDDYTSYKDKTKDEKKEYNVNSITTTKNQKRDQNKNLVSNSSTEAKAIFVEKYDRDINPLDIKLPPKN